MLSSQPAAPRGLGARIVWLGLALIERLKQSDAPPRLGGSMKTREAAPDEGCGERTPMVARGLMHAGKRQKNNEECHLIREDLGLVIVADGFGGEAGGDVAARTVVDEIARCFAVQETLPNFEPHELRDGLTVATVRFAIEHAHARQRFEARRSGLSGMGAAVAVLVVAGARVVIGHMGDVRVYRFCADGLEQLTSDGRDRMRAGLPVEADGGVCPAIRTDIWKPRDRYLVCTAGIHQALGPEPIRCTMATHAGLFDSARALVRRAQLAGATSSLCAVVAGPRSDA